MSKAASVSTEINLIGMTVDEAIAHLDKYLDDAYVAHLPSVRIGSRKRNRCTAQCRAGTSEKPAVREILPDGRAV